MWSTIYRVTYCKVILIVFIESVDLRSSELSSRDLLGKQNVQLVEGAVLLLISTIQ